MALFNRMKISTRMLIIMLLSAIGFIALSTMALVEIKTSMMEDRKTKIRNLVEYAEEAQEQADEEGRCEQ